MTPFGEIEKDPPHLTQEYYKARRQLMLWSALLLSWELIGLDLESLRAEEGTVGIVIRSLKSPEIIPWILLSLVIYFGFRVGLEWYQCPLQRRILTVSRVDFSGTFLISFMAVVLFVLHKVSETRITETMVGDKRRWTIALVAYLGVWMWTFFSKLRIDLKYHPMKADHKKRKREILRCVAMYGSVFIISMVALYWLNTPASSYWIGIGVAVTVGIGLELAVRFMDRTERP